MKLRIGFALLVLGVASLVYLFFVFLGLLLEVQKGGNLTDDVVRFVVGLVAMVLFLSLGIRLTREYRETGRSRGEDGNVGMSV